MGKEYAYRKKLLSAGFNLQEKKEQCYAAAHAKGYSVVEIAVRGGEKSAKYVHAALVKQGLIPPGKPGRQSRKVELPEKFAKALKRIGITFSQWRAGWEFGEDEAMAGVTSLQGRVGEAVKRDFPYYYQEETGINTTNCDFDEVVEPFDVVLHLTWDGIRKSYVVNRH